MEKVVFCGVTDENGKPVKLSKEQKKRFKNSFNTNNVIFCDDNIIPNTMEMFVRTNNKN
jgi:hypothetical protein